MSDLKRKSANANEKTKRKSPVGNYNSFIYPDMVSNSSCARFAYRYPIELVRAYEAAEQNNPDNREILKRIIPTEPETDWITDKIIDTILKNPIYFPSEGEYESRMDQIIAAVAFGRPLHRIKELQAYPDPRETLRDKIKRIAKKLDRIVEPGDDERGRPSREKHIRMALYFWWADNFESKVTVGVDKHGNPRSGRSPTLTSSGPSRRELIPYLKKAGMKNVPSISNKLFWEEVKAYAEWRKELLVIHWYAPVDRL
jgi:hypothetical protein